MSAPPAPPAAAPPAPPGALAAAVGDSAPAALPVGAIKRVIFSDEAWYASSARLHRAPHVVEEWSLGVDARSPGGCYEGTHGEVSLEWVELSSAISWRLRAFGDGLPVVHAAGLTDLLAAHGGADPQTLRSALLAAGWVDLTERSQGQVRAV